MYKYLAGRFSCSPYIRRRKLGFVVVSVGGWEKTRTVIISRSPQAQEICPAIYLKGVVCRFSAISSLPSRSTSPLELSHFISCYVEEY